MCLKPGHSKKDCTVSIKCFKCGARGNHPTALCQQTREERNSEKTPTERKEENEKNNEEIKTSTVETVVIEKSQNLVDDSCTARASQGKSD